MLKQTAARRVWSFAPMAKFAY